MRKIGYIAEIASGVKTISKGDFDHRVAIMGNDELALLAKEVNRMAGELGGYFEREKNREKLRSELMLSISHDLKSPLTAVIGYLSLLKDREYDSEETMADYTERAYRKSLRIKELLQELLEFANLSDEDIMMDRRTISIDHMLEQLVAEYAGGFERNGLRLAADFECESLYADVDPEYMIRVFENLLSNSIRYGAKPGEVRITLRKIDGNIVIAISNKTGEIDKKELDRLFDKFYRLEKSRSEETGGTGLGLAIARKITELHGGKIWAEYSDGEITFRVVIPVVTAGVIRVTGDMGSTCP